MIWADIQQSMYFTHNYFNDNSNNNRNSSPTSTDMQPNRALKQQSSLIVPTLYNKNVRTGSMSSSTEDEDESTSSSGRKNLKRKASSSVDRNEDEGNTDEKRKNFLERNRQAALKCRQRKKQWLNSLQERVEYLANDNEQLQLQANVMRDEVLSLRSLLMVHKDCHITNNTMILPQHQQIPHHVPIQTLTQQRHIDNNNSSNNHNSMLSTTIKMI
ncbi:hypothetical protein BD770DRAFT_409866 [Pilaira anomala]|nr:hypothetical protein BD770DRAFT_409866 [Pilaira anomala]